MVLLKGMFVVRYTLEFSPWGGGGPGFQNDPPPTHKIRNPQTHPTTRNTYIINPSTYRIGFPRSYPIPTRIQNILLLIKVLNVNNQYLYIQIWHVLIHSLSQYTYTHIFWCWCVHIICMCTFTCIIVCGVCFENVILR